MRVGHTAHGVLVRGCTGYPAATPPARPEEVQPRRVGGVA